MIARSDCPLFTASHAFYVYFFLFKGVVFCFVFFNVFRFLFWNRFQFEEKFLHSFIRHYDKNESIKGFGYFFFINQSERMNENVLC